MVNGFKVWGLGGLKLRIKCLGVLRPKETRNLSALNPKPSGLHTLAQ